MSQIRSNALQIINENYNQTSKDTTLREYVELTASSDPGFYAWLFNEELVRDGDSSLTEGHKEQYQQFLKTLG